MLCFFNVFIYLLNLFTKSLNSLNSYFFIIPLSFLACKFCTQFCQFLLQMLQTFFTKSVFFCR